MLALNPSDALVPVRVDASGALITSGGAGGGGAGGGDASAANQTAQTAELVAIKGHVDGIEAALAPLSTIAANTGRAPAPADTTATALPTDFDTLPVAMTYSGTKVATIARTNGTNTWTQTLTYTGDNLTAISGWVRT